MTAYLLCAGFGTRMQPLTDATPKSLLPIAGRPLLSYLLDELTDWTALDAIHVVTNHRDIDAFRAWADDWRDALRDDDVALRVHDDGVSSPAEQLGAVGDLQFLLNETDPSAGGALVSGGDSLYRFPLAPILNAFEGIRNQVLALYEPDPERRKKSSVLRLSGHRVRGLSGALSPTDTERICPSWHLLSPDALGTVEPYLHTGGDRDSLGMFIDAVARRTPVQAIRLPEKRALRLHCNTPDDLKRARQLLRTEPHHLLDAEAVQQCLERA